MREGRASLMSAKLAEQRKIERATKERERAELARQIAEEEKKVKDLEVWVTNWARAHQMRDFITALENAWAQQGHDLSPALKGHMLPSPPSILDRKGELGPYW